MHIIDNDTDSHSYQSDFTSFSTQIKEERRRAEKFEKLIAQSSGRHESSMAGEGAEDEEPVLDGFFLVS